VIRAAITPTFESFRERARGLLAAGVAPRDVTWDDGTGQASLFGGGAASADTSVPSATATAATPARVPAAFVAKGELAALHSDADRWDVLYRVVHRLAHGEPELLEIATDPDVARLARLVTDVKHDEHRMHAFLRFRRVSNASDASDASNAAESFVAWYEPDHDIVALAAPHFARRYPNMRWVILTPRRTAVWDGASLQLADGAQRDSAPRPDELEDLFRSYYGAIFNPARTNLALFAKHVPSRFQRAMPEIAITHELAIAAPARTLAMQNKKVSPSLEYVPARPSYASLVRASKGCEACHLYKNATQTVFGEGPVKSKIVFVGEQPGDQEDLEGHPFVGPAGRVFDQALADLSIPRDQVYVTNAVKHFKWEPRGKRRIHSKPNAMEVHACHGWLEAELALVKPEVIVCLGATAAQAFMGRTFKITQSRGKVLDGAPWAPKLIATYHPSALLRMMRDPELYERAKGEFENDLRKAGALVGLGKRHSAA
jgi:probable DNA metabolism protein